MILVSVIVVSYNSQDFIFETLESIKNQDYKNLELIISDDGSKDHTHALLKDWLSENEERFSAVKVILNPVNTGTPANCNRGCRQASGKYLKLIAADDLLEKNCISSFVTAAENLNAQFLISNLKYIDEKSKTLPRSKSYFPEFLGSLAVDKQLKLFSRYAEFINVPSWFYTKLLWEQLGGFDESYHLLEDVPFFMKVLATGHKCHYVDQPLVSYRIHSKSSIVRQNDKLTKELTRTRDDERLIYLSKFNLKDHLYYIDERIHFMFSGKQNKKFYYLTRIWNAAFWAKLYLTKTNNSRYNRYIKAIIS